MKKNIMSAMIIIMDTIGHRGINIEPKKNDLIKKNSIILLTLFTFMETEFKLASYNCNGFKGSQGYVQDLISGHDVTFLSEHWLRQSEIPVIQSDLNNDNYWSVFKSSMDHEIILQGRPYGGTGFVCKRKQSVFYQNIECNSDRICMIQVCDSDGVRLNVIGIYMPFWNNSYEHVLLYIEILEKVQVLYEEKGGNAPFIIMGDLNTSLPQCLTIQNNWNKRKPFNKFSQLLYDFIEDNNLYVANFHYEQEVNFTYSKGGNKSYIDHVLVSRYIHDNVTGCKILSNDSSNTSDHLALSVSLDQELIYKTQADVPTTGEKAISKYPKPNWDDAFVKKI
jgi:exonuclease III